MAKGQATPLLILGVNRIPLGEYIYIYIMSQRPTGNLSRDSSGTLVCEAPVKNYLVVTDQRP